MHSKALHAVLHICKANPRIYLRFIAPTHILGSGGISISRFSFVTIWLNAKYICMFKNTHAPMFIIAYNEMKNMLSSIVVKKDI